MAVAAPTGGGIGVVTRALHWLTAVLLAAAFGLAWSFNTLGPGGTAGRLVDIHRSVGLTILGLTTVRLVWRLFHPLPALPLAPRWEQWLARGVQAAFYPLLVAQPVLGWVGSSAQGDTVAYLGALTLPDLVDVDPDFAERIFGAHKLVGFVLLGLMALHVAGALRHALLKGDGVLRRMAAGAPIR